MKKTITFEVTMPHPKTYGVRGLKEYVHEAVVYWGGEFYPEDELFGLNRKNVKVRRIKP
jgi:hypothetical protein